MAVATPVHERAAGRKALAKKGLALPDGGFPVPNASYWDKARQAIGRVKSPARRAAVARLLRKTAPRFGKSAALKQSWAAPGGKGSKHSNEMEFAMPRIPVASPYDLIISRGDDGSAVVRHRRGGGEITRIRRTDAGTWVAAVDGRDLAPHTRQRGALLEAIGNYNRAAPSPYHRPAESPPLQPRPVQTDLMRAVGIPAINAQLATPAVGAGDGPRTTLANGDGNGNGNGNGDGKDENGLTAKGQAIYKKLKARGFPDARALAFAKRAQNVTGPPGS